MKDVFEKVEKVFGSERPEYILKNGKAFNIYGAYNYIKEQQDTIDQLNGELEDLKDEVVSASIKISALLRSIEPSVR